jgi:hypothetical protein
MFSRRRTGQQDRSMLLPTITGLLNSQSYTPQQQSDITQQSLGAWERRTPLLTPYASVRQIARPPQTIPPASAT